MRSMVLLSTLLAAGVAQAAPTGYVGVLGGVNLVLDDWDLYEGDDPKLTPNTSPAVGVFGGVDLSSWLAAEGSVTLLPFTSDGDELNLALSYSVDALFFPLEGEWVPFAGVGGGGYHNVSGDHGADLDYHLHWGLGLRGKLTDSLMLRVDARHILSDADSSAFSNNIELTARIAFVLGGDKAPADRDGDGVPDESDRCPDAPAPGGCPDTDGDGFTDDQDRCPTEPGTDQGCRPAEPDADGDGIPDAADACPEAKGLAEAQGCPDGDADGVIDGQDKCANEPGPAATEGCPDRDGDGITDASDACADEAGTPKAKGCPDRDKDGVADKDDKCPDEAGAVEDGGCVPREVVKAFAGTLKGIQFKTGSAKLKKSSKPNLDACVDVLVRYPSLRVRVEGHTDDVGDAARNKELSLERAQMVRRYLVSRGIDADRIVAEGFGSEQPKAPNKTNKGRAENRRIEFKIITD